MPTNPDAIVDELDRTDELPRLDVEAYEATLANNEKALTRTDTWSVSALHGMEELADANGHERSSSVVARSPESGALTINVDAILKRIADLETDVVTAHEANEALQKRSEALEADRDRLSARVQTSESENARQREHRELAQAMAERVACKQREELQQANARIEELQTLLSAEGRRTHAEQTAFQERLANLTDENSRLVDGQCALQAELAAAHALSQERADDLTDLEDALRDKKVLATQLTRQLAAKLADVDKLSSLLDARNHAVDELIATRNSLSERLQNEVELGIELTRRLSEMEQRCEAQRTQLDEQTLAIGDRDKQLSAATEIISALRENLSASELRVEQTQRDMAVVRGARAEDEQRKLEQLAALQDAQQTIASLRGEIEAGRARIDALADERDALLPLETQLAERTEELERARAELEAAQADLAERAQDTQQRASELDAMRSNLRDQGQALRTLEHTMATREELAKQLRAQLQTLQDESASVASQLEKAHRRVKALTQEVFRRDHRIAELRTELTVHTEALAAIRRDVNRIGKDDEGAGHDDAIERVLEPLGHDGPSIVLSGTMLTVGRTTESDVCIPSKLVSRDHARLLVGPTGVIIEDAGSTNGCYVNGKQVRKHLMHDGDVLELGDLRYRLQPRATLGDTKVRANVIPMFEPRTQ